MDKAAAPQFDPIRHRRGGRPRKAANERRAHQLNIRLTPDEWADGEARAAAAGLSLCEYGRLVLSDRALSIEVAPVPPPEIVRQLRALGHNLDQALHEARRMGFSDVARRALEQAARTVSTELRALFHGPER